MKEKRVLVCLVARARRINTPPPSPPSPSPRSVASPFSPPCIYVHTVCLACGSLDGPQHRTLKAAPERVVTCADTTRETKMEARAWSWHLTRQECCGVNPGCCAEPFDGGEIFPGA